MNFLQTGTCHALVCIEDDSENGIVLRARRKDRSTLKYSMVQAGWSEQM
jgi:hypothetical protein